jgi:hypothetical protein
MGEPDPEVEDFFVAACTGVIAPLDGADARLGLAREA